VRVRRFLALLLLISVGVILSPRAQQDAVPSARLVPAPLLAVPGAIDSNVPMLWDLVEGTPSLFAFASWGGVPALLAGTRLEGLQRVENVTFRQHPGHGIWLESVIADDGSAWYAYYHHEIPAYACGRPDRSIPAIGAARSIDRGRTWEDLGIVLEAPPGGAACGSSNRYVIGGVGDVSAVLDDDRRDLFLFFSQYSRDASAQGVALARLAWADREAPVGKVMVWNKGAWLPARHVARSGQDDGTWEYPAGTPLQPVTKPWHDSDGGADAFWGPSLHWNTHLQRYVMLLNRTRDEGFRNEGLYVSFAKELADPRAWSVPRKLMNGGGWYPQVAGLDAGSGSDKQAGQRARFFVTGRSEYYIEFQR
jgi:hypothetical protein